MKDSVLVIFFESKSNPMDDWGVEEVCADEVIAKSEVEKLSVEFPFYKFSMTNYELVK